MAELELSPNAHAFWADFLAMAGGPEFAAAEGEDDGSLESWRRGHWAYFGRECARIGRDPDAGMPVVCESFRVVFPRPPSAA